MEESSTPTAPPRFDINVCIYYFVDRYKVLFSYYKPIVRPPGVGASLSNSFERWTPPGSMVLYVQRIRTYNSMINRKPMVDGRFIFRRE